MVTSIVVLCSENKKWEDLLVLPLPQVCECGCVEDAGVTIGM